MNSRQPAQDEAPRPVLRIVLFFTAMFLIVIVIVGVTGLLIYNSVVRPRHEAKAVAPFVTVAPFVSIDTDAAFPVGLTTATDGSMYLSLFGNGTIRKVDAQGATTVYKTNTGLLTALGAIAAAPDGSFYVIDYASPNLASAVGSLKHILPDGKVVSTGDGNLPIFAQLAFDKDGNLYVTNPNSSTPQIWRCSGTPTQGWCNYQWWTPPAVGNARALPTGVVYDAAHNGLLVGDAGTGSIYRVNIGPDGKSTDTLVLNRETNLEVQSLALDSQGRLLYIVWRNDNGQLNRLETNGAVTVLADNFRAPLGLAVKDNSIYVVNSDLTGIIPPILGFIPSPFRATPPFTVDVVKAS